MPDAIDGPHQEISLETGRPIFFALPRAEGGGLRPRWIGHLHGMCGPPSYACGKWIAAGTELGIMVCPTGNARCGDPTNGPASWEAPTWPELVDAMDAALESSITKVTSSRSRATARSSLATRAAPTPRP